MVFVNISGRGLYMQCCHREVEPGGSFTVSWESVKHNRAVRAAMSAGALSWSPSSGEPAVPGSPSVPSPAVPEAHKVSAASVDKAPSNPDEPSSGDFGRHMRNLGKFKANTITPRVSRSERVASEDPLTEADIITDVPLSLDAIRRHNAAVHKFGAGKG